MKPFSSRLKDKSELGMIKRVSVKATANVAIISADYGSTADASINLTDNSCMYMRHNGRMYVCMSIVRFLTSPNTDRQGTCPICPSIHAFQNNF